VRRFITDPDQARSERDFVCMTDGFAGEANDHGAALPNLHPVELAAAGNTDKRAHDRLFC